MKIYTELIDLSNDIRQTFFVSPFSDYKMGVKVVQDVGFKVMDGDVELSPEAELIDGYTIYSLKSTEPGRKTYMVTCDNGQSIPIVEVTQKSTVYDVGSVKKTSELVNDSGFISGDKANVLETDVAQNSTDILYLKTEIETVRSDKADKTQLPTKTSELVNDSGYTTQSYVDNAIGNVLTQETF